MQFRDRVKELRRVKARELYANPRNWRTHPQSQQNALRGVLQEIGYADALIARELPDGTLELIDGHLRAETTPDQDVPVLVLDVDQDEANKLLTLLDPLAAMAETNKDALASLLQELQTNDDSIESMIQRLASSEGIHLDMAPADTISTLYPPPTVATPNITNFTPNLAPTTSTTGVTLGQIEDRAAELAANFTAPPIQKKVTCPHCAGEFFIDG